MGSTVELTSTMIMGHSKANNTNEIKKGEESTITNTSVEETQIEIQQFLDSQIYEFLSNNNVLELQQNKKQKESSNSNQENDNKELSPTLTISTHNVRGVNKLTKQNNILEEMKEKKIDILGISETKLPQAVTKHVFKDNPKYKCFASSNEDKHIGGEVAIILTKELEKHIEHITKVDGHIIALHMLFKKSKVYIIQVYLPNNKSESTKYQRIVKNIVNEELKEKTKIIVMGDFNAASNPRIDRPGPITEYIKNKPEAEIFSYLIDWGFIDVQLAWEEESPSPTWYNRTTYSRIDYIWSSPELISENLHSFQNEKAEEMANSDHTLLSIKLYKGNLIDKTNHKPAWQKGTTRVIDIKNTTKEQWDNYAQKVDKKIHKSEINKLIKNTLNELIKNENTTIENEEETNKNKLDKIWEEFRKILTISAYASLKIQKIKDVRQNTIKKERKHPPEFKKYRKALKMIKALNKTMKSQKEEDLEDLNTLIEEFNKENTSMWAITQHNKIQDINMKSWIAWKKDITEAIQALKKECIRKKNQETSEKIKKAISQRCTDLKENPKKMINSLTNQYKNSVSIDRIIVNQENNIKYISTDQKEIKNQVENYYLKAFGKRNSNFQNLSKEWKDQYKPKEYINPDWYANLLKRPNDQEINEILKELPANKASGPSGIPYEMIKKLNKMGKDILKDIFYLCMLISKIPSEWKISNIYPIPKKSEWNTNLHNTRPIMLMETVRKCFTKIITNRLSEIYKIHQILRGPNFAGLPGESTQEPIQLLNSICEEAREEKKELWILLQDTAKAFDTVNLEMLEKALQRIRLPEKMVELIIFLFKNRQFRVITTHGLTNLVQAGDGIDQGETISPLLWRIFYDPLLCKIQNNKKLGYSMKCSWNPDVNSSEKKLIKLRSATIAFMDDTTWIARSKENMQLILDDAREFYKANDSQINSSKSILIVINGKNRQMNEQHVKAGLRKEIVNRLDNKEFARFLGVWIGSTNPKKDIIPRIKNEINKITNVLKQKKATEKQATYIINRILMLRIEYRLQHCFISEKVCNKLSVELRRTVRNKLGISNTTPNSTVHHKGIVNLKSIMEIQTESHITSLINRLNNTGPSGIATIIRLKQAQIVNWEPTNILTEGVPNSFTCKDNFAANALKMTNNRGIKFENNELEKTFQWQGGNFTIKNGINNISLYLNSVTSIRSRKLIYINQLIDKELGILLSWKITKITNTDNRKGPEPKWYKILRQNITNNNGLLLNSNWKSLPWQDIQNIKGSKISEDKRIKEWYCKLNDKDKVLWGKIIKKEGKTSIISHYNIKNKGAEMAELSQCDKKDCILGSKDKEKEKATRRPQLKEEECIITTDTNQLIGPRLLNRPRGNTKLKTIQIPSNVYTLENSIREEIKAITGEGITTSEVTGVQIENWDKKLIERLITSEEQKCQLIERLVQNIEEGNNKKMTYKFYTDRSLSHRGTQLVRMEAAWIQTAGPKPGSHFKTGVENWPSASRAEATAIATALLTVPQNQKVKICTNSQNCIDTYHKLSTNNPKLTSKRWIKTNNWSIWLAIIETIKEKRLKLEMTKVKAHSKDPWNDKADRLAKKASLTSNIRWAPTEIYKIQTTPKWNGITIDIASRNFIKEINKVKVLKDWTEQNRIKDLLGEQIQNYQVYGWRQLWGNFKKNSNKTSEKNNTKRSFWIKLLHNELPTLDNLAVRRPDLYDNFKECKLCLEENESRDHLFQCKKLENALDLAWNKTIRKFEEDLQQTIKKRSEDKSTKRKGPCLQDKNNTICKNHLQNTKVTIKKTSEILDNEKNKSKKFLINFALGLVNNNLIKEMVKTTSEYRITSSKMRTLLTNTSNKFREHFRKDVWNYRCTEVCKTDTLRGISGRTKKKKEKKKKKKEKEIKKQETRKQTRTLSETTNKKESKENPKENKKTEIHILEEIRNKIHDWIQRGSKWLGII